MRPTYSDDPHIVINNRPTTLDTQRLCDTFKSVYANDDVKKYKRQDASFSHLPSEVCNVLINKFADLDKLNFTTIQKHAEIPIPQGLDLQPDLFHLPPQDTLDSQHKAFPNSELSQQISPMPPLLIIKLQLPPTPPLLIQNLEISLMPPLLIQTLKISLMPPLLMQNLQILPMPPLL